MNATIDNLVKQLKYAGRDGDFCSAYVEALVINVKGQKKYVLHRMNEDYSYETYEDSLNHTNGKYRNIHAKIEFKNEKELLKVFPYGFDERWISTDETCGYKIPVKEFEKVQLKSRN